MKKRIAFDLKGNGYLTVEVSLITNRYSLVVEYGEQGMVIA